MNFVYTLKDYECDKKCPYCITKILKRKGEEDVHKLKDKLEKLKSEGKVFDEFVLSGNGEPSLYDIETLKTIRDIVDNSGMFVNKRIQTSGNLFHNDDKLYMFRNWIKEITIVSTDEATDMEILKYSKPYWEKAKKQWYLRVNVVVLNGFQAKETIEEVLTMFETTPAIALKILDASNNWIVENAFPWEGADQLVAHMSEISKDYCYNHISRRYIFRMNRIVNGYFLDDFFVTMSYGKEHAPDHIDIEVKYE